MRKAKLLSGAAIGLLAGAAAAAQPRALPTPAPGAWVSEVGVFESYESPEARAPRIYPSATWRSFYGRITTADLPAEFRSRAFEALSEVAIEADAVGRATGCAPTRPSSEPALDALACALLPQRGAFPVRYEAPGRPVPGRWTLRVRWQTLSAEAFAERERRRRAMPAPPAPPAAPPFVNRGWPRLGWPAALAPVSLPDVQAAYPARAGRPAEGTTSLDILVSRTGGITGCEIGLSSGNPALDEAACRLARGLDLIYRAACLDCDEQRQPLQVVWHRRHGSHVRFPLLSAYDRGPALPRDAADTRTASHYDAYERHLLPPADAPDEPPPRDRTYATSRVRLLYSLGPDGRVASCQVAASSGNAALDRWLCRRLSGRVQFTARTDIFGDPAPSAELHPIVLDLDRLLR